MATSLGKRWRLSPDVWKARLSKRIALWVFLSIVVIEAIILVPSVLRRERELLTYLKSLSAAQAQGLLTAAPLDRLSPEALLHRLEAIQQDAVILGGSLYRVDGTLVGTFGEAPSLALTAVEGGQRDRYDRRTQRYDALWEMSPLEGDYYLIIRHDAAWVGREFYAFIGRIAGLVVIISIFVTGATMVVLEPLVIAPIMALRRDLLRAGHAIRHHQDARSLGFESRPQQGRSDELGEVVTAFEDMVQQVTAAIAERDQAEANLRLSEEKFSKAFYASPNPMILSTLAEGRLLEINDSFTQLYGMGCEQVLGRTVLDIGLWVAAGDRAAMLETLRTHGYVRNQEYQFQSAQGDPRTVLFSAETVQLNGEPCLLAVANDITERQQAEQALRESEMRFRTLVEQATDALFVVAPDGRFLDVNQQACQTLGYRREELLQLGVPDIQKAVTLADLAADWQRAGGQPTTREGIHARKDGSTFPVEVRLGRIDMQGRPVLLALARDITERKQAELARARLAEIGELAAMIVHEVRNPLTTVLMGLQSFADLDLPERAQRRLGFALEESERLQRLLNEILVYAREQTVDQVELSLTDLLQTLAQHFSSQPLAQACTLQWQGLETAVYVVGDRDKLTQVFINLLSNACEATPPGETVTCTLVPEPHQVSLICHNPGDPIPPEVLPKLTQPFFTTKPSGNGLGLAITRRILDAHKGTLHITSSADRGTVVTVTLPRRG
ncbi:MAG: PAS domain S-box protein [Cyanobacteria bacterium]|nr:PAS domain S-box protein [Cyanobacteriota bacterium]